MPPLLHRLRPLLAGPLLLAAAVASTPLDEVVALPEFRVFDTRPLPEREKWDYVRVGNFEILSSTSPRTTRIFARDLDEFQKVLRHVAPEMVIRAEQPVMVVLCGREQMFARFAAAAAVRTTRGRGTSLVRDSEIAAIIVDYENPGSEARPLAMAPPGFFGRFHFGDLFAREVHTTQEFLRQYIHLSLSQLATRPPVWLAEGLANIYANIDYDNARIEIGHPKSFVEEITTTVSSPAGAGSGGFSRYADNVRNGYYDYQRTGVNMLANTGASYTYQLPLAIMPMAKLLAVNFDSPEMRGTGPGGDFSLSTWRRQATAFVHLCLYGENGRYRRALLKFAVRTGHEPATEELFKECFGLGYNEMALRLRGHSEFTRYTGALIKPIDKRHQLLAPRANPEVRPATDAEIGRIKGEALRLSGQEEAARAEFVTAYLRGERDLQLLASLGLMARQRQDDRRARTYLEAVAASPSPVPRPRAYLELARLRAEEIRSESAGRPLPPERLTAVLTPLFVAHNLPQQLSLIYREIAAAWLTSAVPPQREHIGVVEYGRALFPADGDLVLATAELLLRNGFRADALAHLDQAIARTRDPDLRAKLDRLRN